MRKLLITAALIGAAALVLPSSATYAQTGTKGVGAPLTGSGPGTNMGDPNATNATGPGARPMAKTNKRHATRTRHKRSTVGSSANMNR